MTYYAFNKRHLLCKVFLKKELQSERACFNYYFVHHKVSSRGYSKSFLAYSRVG